MTAKRKLILIGDSHDKNVSTDLLAEIVKTFTPVVLLEISKKWDINRLYSFWTTQGTPEYEKRRAVLGPLAFQYTRTYFPDMDYDSHYYQNDVMREDMISSNIENIMKLPDHDTGVLLIGYDHIYRLYQQLHNEFDFLILIPTAMDQNFYKKTTELVQTTEGFFFSAETITDAVKNASDFVTQTEQSFSAKDGAEFGS